MEQTLLLNATYEPLKVVHWQKAMTLWCQGKVEVISVVRPRGAVGLLQLQAAVGHPPAALHQDQAQDRLRPVFARQHLRPRRSLVPVLRRGLSHRGADVRSCRAGRPGRPKGLGEHRHLLHHLQPPEGRAHAGRGRHAPDTRARSVPTRRRPSASPSGSRTPRTAGATTSTGTWSSTRADAPDRHARRTPRPPAAPVPIRPRSRDRSTMMLPVRRRITAVRPLWAVEGGRVTIAASGLRRSIPCRREVLDRRHAGAARRRLVATRTDRDRARRPRRRAHAGARRRASPGETAFVEVGAPLATGLHQVDNPAFDAAGNLYVTYSGSRGQQAPVSIFIVRPDGTREPFVVRHRRTRRRWRSIRDGRAVRVEPLRRQRLPGRRPTAAPTVVATDLGVACGLAFAPDGTLFVGDRSGTILRVATGATAPFATLPPSVAAFHLAFGPDGWLYVTAPDARRARQRLSRLAGRRRRRVLRAASAGRRASRSTPAATCTSSTRSPARAACTG